MIFFVLAPRARFFWAEVALRATAGAFVAARAKDLDFVDAAAFDVVRTLAVDFAVLAWADRAFLVAFEDLDVVRADDFDAVEAAPLARDCAVRRDAFDVVETPAFGLARGFEGALDVVDRAGDFDGFAPAFDAGLAFLVDFLDLDEAVRADAFDVEPVSVALGCVFRPEAFDVVLVFDGDRVFAGDASFGRADVVRVRLGPESLGDVFEAAALLGRAEVLLGSVRAAAFAARVRELAMRPPSTWRRPVVADQAVARAARSFSWSSRRWHFLYFLPEPHQHGSLAPGRFRRLLGPWGVALGSEAATASALA